MQNVDSDQSAARHCNAAKILMHKVALSATLCFKSQPVSYRPEEVVRAPTWSNEVRFFPLPIAEVQRLKNWLAFAEQFSALDPCVGDREKATIRNWNTSFWNIHIVCSNQVVCCYL